MTRRPQARRRSRSRGYTMVELMMAMTVFAIGVTGIAAMQKITLASNLHAKKLAIASHIAQSWQERLTADTSLWPSTATAPTAAQWLSDTAGEDWQRAPTNTAVTFGGTFGPLGEFTPVASEAYFCVDIRLTTLRSGSMPVGTPVQGNGLMRSEVRVFWPRDGREPAGGDYCTSAIIGAGSDDNFHIVYDVAAVRQAQ